MKIQIGKEMQEVSRPYAFVLRTIGRRSSSLLGFLFLGSLLLSSLLLMYLYGITSTLSEIKQTNDSKNSDAAYKTLKNAYFVGIADD